MPDGYTIEDALKIASRLDPVRRAFVESQLNGDARQFQIRMTEDEPEPDPRELSKLESDEQAEVVRVLIKAGCVVYNLSQKRPSKQTAGIPDLWWTCPTRGISGWFEVKRSEPIASDLTGLRKKTQPMTPEQIQFRDECLYTGTPHGVGDRHDAAKFVRQVITGG